MVHRVLLLSFLFSLLLSACGAKESSFSEPVSDSAAAPASTNPAEIIPAEVSAERRVMVAAGSDWRIVILDSKKFQELLDGADFNTVALNGHVDHSTVFNSQIRAGQPYCMVLRSGMGRVHLENNFESELNIFVADSNERRPLWKLVLEASGIEILCTKMSRKKLTFNEVRKSLRGIFELRRTQ